ncbi:hypothetical protein CRN81_12920 [Chromobacterium violaceum]|nr:hypothetical protein CRN81_12920 [Chromobacterium violaceum]
MQGLFDAASALNQQVSTFISNKMEAAKEAKEALKSAEDSGLSKDSDEYHKLQQAVIDTEADAAKWAPGSKNGQVTTAILAGITGNLANGLSGMAQNAGLAYLQGMGAQEVKAYLQDLSNHGMSEGQTEALRTVLQAAVGCAGAAASGQNCGAGAAGGASAVALNNALNVLQNLKPEDMNAEQKADRENLVNALVTGAAVGTGGASTAAATVNAAKTEVWWTWRMAQARAASSPARARNSSRAKTSPCRPRAISICWRLRAPAASTPPVVPAAVDGNGSQYQLSELNAGGKLNLVSGGNVTLQGIAKGQQVVGDIAGNLKIDSLQDTSTYHSLNQSISAQGSMSGGSATLSQQKMDADYASVQRQSGIQAGDGGFQLKVKGTTTLNGAEIASTDKAAQDGKNSLQTGALVLKDIDNHADFTASSVSVTAGSGGVSGMAMAASDHDNSTTRAGISAGSLTITDNALQQAQTGQTAAQAASTANRDVSSDRDGSGKLANNFNANQVQGLFDAASALNQQATVNAAKTEVEWYAGIDRQRAQSH